MTNPHHRAWHREPLLHFAVLGGLILGVEQWRARQNADDAVATSKGIIVDADLRARLAERFEAQRNQPPNEEQLKRLVERWVDEELLVREALRLGLDRDDPEIRKRLLAKMKFIAAEQAIIQEPDDATLQAFVELRPAHYAGPPRRQFVLVTFGGPQAQAMAEQARDKLRAGAGPREVGGRVATGKQFTPSNIVGTYGQTIADAIFEATVGEWVIVEIDRGWSAILLESVTRNSTPVLAKIRKRVARDWADAQRAKALGATLTELRRTAQVVIEP